MTPLRLRPLLMLALVGAVLVSMLVLGAARVLGTQAGRRSDESGGALAMSLRSSAQLEVERIHEAWRAFQSDVDEVLHDALALTAGPLDENAVIPWKPGLCTRLAFPGSVERAGVVDVDGAAVVSLVELGADRCTDRTASFAIQSVTGPPFPSTKDVQRLTQSALTGMFASTEGETRLVAVHRDGARGRVRLARREGSRVAFVDVDLTSIAPVVVHQGVQVHALLIIGGEPAGYVTGGPKEAALGGAVRDVKRGVGRALDLPDIAQSTAVPSVDSWLRPEHDDGKLALGGVAVTLDARLEVRLLAVASAAWPLATTSGRVQQVTLILMGICAWLMLILVLTRRLAAALWRMAQEVREAWLGQRDDDVGSPADVERARRLLATLTDRSEDILVAAFGRAERFWAPGPIKRLLEILRRRMEG